MWTVSLHKQILSKDHPLVLSPSSQMRVCRLSRELECPGHPKSEGNDNSVSAYH